MTASISIARNERGNDEAHVTGCAHLKGNRLVVRADGMAGWAGARFEGATLVAAIRAADEDMAAAFGQKVYDPDPSDQPWTVSVMAAPCIRTALRAEGYTRFAETGEPRQRTARKAEKEGTTMAATYPYEVKYETASGTQQSVTVEAVDAIDAKHLAEAQEGAVITAASARKLRGKAAKEAEIVKAEQSFREAKDAAAEPKTMTVRVQYSVTINVTEYRAAYGDESPDQIRDAVRAAVQSVIPSSAVFAEGIVLAADEVGLPPRKA